MPDATYRFKRPDSATLCAVLLGFFFLLSGCAGPSGVASSSTVTVVDFEKIAMVPIHVVTTEDPRDRFVRCPLTGTFHRTCGQPAETAGRDLEELFASELRANRNFVQIPPERVEGVLQRVKAASFKESTGNVLRKVGEELGADGVVAGYVFCYQERVGYTYAAEQPASAVFSFHLVNVGEGNVVWSGTLDKTQESLMGNVLDVRTFFRGGGKWITVRELSAQGIRELITTFPTRE